MLKIFRLASTVMAAALVIAFPKVAVSMVIAVDVEPGVEGFQLALVAHSPEEVLVQMADIK